jgi:hypothetical protein
MYLTREGSVHRPQTSGPWRWLAGQIPWMADQLLCWFGPKLHGDVSTREGEGQEGEEIRWRPNSLAGQPPLGELLARPSRRSSPTAL